MSTGIEWTKPDGPLDGCPWGCGAPANHGETVRCPPLNPGGDDWANGSHLALGNASQLRGDIAALGATREEARNCEPCSRIITKRIRTIADQLEKRRQP